ncbi:MAG TPA: DUF2169 domain-containing protein [Minicystis sp.]|nr:DUF2169 domain-containing protein [Minicystis sp.]
MKTDAITEQVMLASGEADDGAPALSCLVKRTYTLDPKHGLVVAAEQRPLQILVPGEEDPEIVVEESDVVPLKELTDVVVRGHVHVPRPATRATASVSVGAITKDIVVHGDRRAERGPTADVRFTPALPFDKMPLSYRNAYGGEDRVALAKYGNPYLEWMKYAPEIAQRSRHSPYRYPRNGVGKGYLFEVTDAALDALELPNLEDPSDPLTPERLAVRDPRAWPTMPLPWSTDWLSLGAFPRTAYYGAAPAFDLPPDELAEVARGFLAKDAIKPPFSFDAVRLRIANAGSLGLQLGPFTAAHAATLELRLVNLHPKRPTLAFRLPPGAPEIRVDGRSPKGTLVPTSPVLHHVVIEPDADRVSVVWRGSTPVMRRYHVDELVKMPLSVVWPEA